MHVSGSAASDEDALDLLQTDSVAGAVIQVGRARRLVVGDLEPAASRELRIPDCTTVCGLTHNPES
jgi:hypothetical protein